MIILKVNNNRDYKSMKTEAYYDHQYKATDKEGYPEAGCCDMNMGMGMGMAMPNMMGETIPGVVCPPVYECPRETICHRYICHEVPHIIPCNTRIINHHIYRHTYAPTYSCCEENEVQNVYERRCC